MHGKRNEYRGKPNERTHRPIFHQAETKQARHAKVERAEHKRIRHIPDEPEQERVYRAAHFPEYSVFCKEYNQRQDRKNPTYRAKTFFCNDSRIDIFRFFVFYFFIFSQGNHLQNF